LGLQWRTPDSEAKWHHMFHTLRRYRAVHGDTEVSPGYANRDEHDWVILGRCVDGWVDGCGDGCRDGCEDGCFMRF